MLDEHARTTPRLVPECEDCRFECDAVDREWIRPGKWETQYRCPCCGEIYTQVMQGMVVGGKGREYYAEQIASKYVNSDIMSLESLERSLDRVMGLD